MKAPCLSFTPDPEDPSDTLAILNLESWDLVGAGENKEEAFTDLARMVFGTYQVQLTHNVTETSERLLRELLGIEELP